MNDTQATVCTFHSSHDAIDAQRRLSAVGIGFRVIPTPTEITSDCGIALLVAAVDTPAVSQTLCSGTHPIVAGLTAASIEKGRLHICCRSVDGG